MVKIEVEVDTLAQLEEALALGVDTILLDNMSIETICRRPSRSPKAARCWKPPATSRSRPLRAIAETGVDYISSGAITHTAPNLDVALDF